MPLESITSKECLQRLMKMQTNILGTNYFTVSVTANKKGTVCCECKIGCDDWNEAHNMPREASVVGDDIDDAFQKLIAEVVKIEKYNISIWKDKSCVLRERFERIENSIKEIEAS